MPQQRIYELIARKLSGEATQAELDELQAYLQENGSDQYIYEILSSYWQQAPDLQEEEAADEEERFQRILHASSPIEISTTVTDPAPIRRVMPLRRWLGYAAAILVIAGSAYFIYQSGREKENPPSSQVVNERISEVVAKSGSRSKLVLPDGTQVWLNGESRLSYEPKFNTAKREVNLEGEAFFDVTHDTQRPFIVHTSGIDIRVLGTAFNVKSYASDETIETTLLRGSIEVVKKNDPSAPKVILRQHEKLVFNKKDLENNDSTGSKQPRPLSAALQTGISITTLPNNKPDSVIKETAWLYNKLNFDGDSFEELAIKMERWYDVTITIRNNRLKHTRLKGSFERETIRQALEALKVITPFEYTITGREIVVE